MVDGGMLSSSVVKDIDLFSWNEITSALNDVVQPVPQTYQELLSDEFKQLLNASIHGFPTARVGTNRPFFEVDPSLVRRVKSPDGSLVFRVTPINRLQTVTVQTGYRRSIGSSEDIPKLVSVSFRDHQQTEWYPGVQVMGEGIFVTLENALSLGSLPNARKWAQLDPNAYSDQLFRTNAKQELTAAFVWWHTLSHLLIRSLSIDAGFSSASIRERVYVADDGEEEGLCFTPLNLAAMVQWEDSLHWCRV